MRRLSAVLMPLLICVSAMANDESAPSKPIKPASAKEDASIQFIDEAKSLPKTVKSRKAAEAARAKEEKDGDEIAAKIAEKLAAIRKAKASAPKIATRPVIRNGALVIRPSNSAELSSKAITEEHGKVAAGAMHWGYEGEGGPLSWGKLSPANIKCDIGERQSPIDIRDGIRVDLDPLNFDYKDSRFSVLDNGHTIQTTLGAGNYINVSGKNYELVQFHFHKPSEERIDGKSFEMVAHLVHKDAEGKLAVVAVLIKRGQANALVQSVWNNLPLEKNQAVNALSTMDLSQILPVRREYYTYMGSLTTPPCSEGVLWLVMKEPIEISADQISIFNRLYPMNARPIQKTSDRLIKESN
jgi:carbonic anhydrase